MTVRLAGRGHSEAVPRKAIERIRHDAPYTHSRDRVPRRRCRADFWLKGGGRTWKTRVLGEAGTASLTAKLKKGVKYTYWCAVSDHASEGMKGSFVAR